MRAVSQGGAQKSSTYECKLAGLVTLPHTESPLWNTLRGMCIAYEYIHEYEYGLRFPIQSGTNSVAAKLITSSPRPDPRERRSDSMDTSYRWILLQEGPPLTGPVYTGLPAAVREVYETVLYGDDGLSFLSQLGATQEYLIERRGNEYTCVHQGLEIKVVVCMLFSRDRDSGMGMDQLELLPKGFSLIEVTAAAPADQQAAVARVVGSFAERLMPMVHLKKA